MKMDLQRFAGSLTVTVIKDVNANWTAASVSPASSLAKDDVVTITATPATGYEIDDIEVVAGGVEIYDDDGALKFAMGESNVTLYFKAKANNVYQIVENCYVSVNGTVTQLTRNTMLKYGVNGAVIGVDVNGTAVTLSADIVDALKKNGAIVKIEGAKFPPKPED